MISVVIPSYNRRECCRELLRDLYAQRGVAFEVIVVDDCSPDDSAAMVRREFPQARLLVNAHNGGPCVARNRGIRAARGNIVVGFDSDVTIPDVELLAKIHEAFVQRPSASGLAMRILGGDGHDDAPRWWHPVPLGRGGEHGFETDYFSGTAYAFRREALLAAGLFPEIYYMHYEEVELAWRVVDGGGKIFFAPELSAVHHANPVSRRSEIKVFYKPRNQVLLALRCLPAGRAIVYLAPRLVYGLGVACVGGSLGSWVRAMASARELGGRCLLERKPLGALSWQRIKAMKGQLPRRGVREKRTRSSRANMEGVVE